jgi:hypothetical protein
MNTAHIRNPHALLRLVKPTEPQRSTRADWSESAICVRAQSILSGSLVGQCPPLTLAQARDVLAWYRPANP